MKRDFTPDSFERFLKHSADNFRVRASDKVWQSLSRKLNRRRRRITYGLTALLLAGSALGYLSITNMQKPLPQQSTVAPVSISKTSAINPIVNNAPAQTTATTITNPAVTTQRSDILLHNQIVASPSGQSDIATISSAPRSSDRTPVAEEKPESRLPIATADSDIKPDANNSTAVAKKETTQPSAENWPLTIESVTNAYQRKIFKNKIGLSLHFSPSISYRKLTENKSYLRSGPSANYTTLYNTVNSAVTHKPDVGFEIGITAKLPVTKKVKATGGLQFNVNRYDIKAFSMPISVGTIALNTGQGTVNSVNTITNYSNFSGYKSDWLQNWYFQVSAPVGIETTIGKDAKTKFGIAATVQPTYVLGDRAYLLTTDYKSYAEVPWLVRRWNVNTALSTFVSYTGKKTTWQVGPQVRYQLLSSFESQYPVKENPFDFGLRVGVSLNRQ